MDKLDAQESARIIQRMLSNLIKTVPSSGRVGANARAKISETIVKAYPWLRDDTIAEPLGECFDLTMSSGATAVAVEGVRHQVMLETPTTLGGTLIMNACDGLCLAAIGLYISDMSFISRQDVDTVKAAIKQPFNDAEETAADAMDQATFMALIKLHAAIVNFLVETARPLPRMLSYQFANPRPSLVLAYRLYDDAGRADEVRAENKIVHPAFCPRLGAALSA